MLFHLSLVRLIRITTSHFSGDPERAHLATHVSTQDSVNNADSDCTSVPLRARLRYRDEDGEVGL